MFLLLIIAIFIYILYKNQSVISPNTNIFYNSITHIPESKLTAKCNSLTDLSCKLYTNVDIKSKCKTLCSNEYPNTVFNGNHNVDGGGIHTCECVPSNSIEQFTLDFTPIKQFKDLTLENPTPNDSLFSDRNYVEKHQESRYNNLIFGK